jgi:hypothetical protein
MNAFAAETPRLNRRETKLVSTFGFLGSKKLAAMQQKYSVVLFRLRISEF